MSGSAPTRPRRSMCIWHRPLARHAGRDPDLGRLRRHHRLLAFRFGVGGVYFAILTIAFCEFTRIGFDHFDWVGGSSGLFLPVANYTRNDLINLRGHR